MDHKTAILIFANSASFEALQKPFRHSKIVFDALSTQTLKTVKKVGMPYFISSEKTQIGNTFGERFTNAILSVFNHGFTKVITIGNDTPQLRPKHLVQAIEKLEENDVVLGPSKDGGFYLMGLKQASFDAASFIKLPWQTPKLNSALTKVSEKKQHSSVRLEVLSDIDSVTDIKYIISSFKGISSALKTLLIRFFISIYTLFVFNGVMVKKVHRSLYLNKGSPKLTCQ